VTTSSGIEAPGLHARLDEDLIDISARGPHTSTAAQLKRLANNHKAEQTIHLVKPMMSPFTHSCLPLPQLNCIKG
jgi:hypothetical protein